MRLLLSVLTIMSAVVLGSQPAVWAQWTSNKAQVSGIFGERTLGESIKPGTRSLSSGGIMRRPGGSFLGRNPQYPGAMFPSPPPLVDFTPERAMAAILRNALPVEAARVPELGGQPQWQSLPDAWIRSNATTGGGGIPGAIGPGFPGVAVPGSLGVATGTGPSRRLSPPLSGGFPVSPPGVGPVDYFLSGSLTSQVSRIPRFQTGSPITVSVAGGTATLDGTVATPHDSKVLAALIRLEPGVSNVNNRLTVKPSE